MVAFRNSLMVPELGFGVLGDLALPSTGLGSQVLPQAARQSKLQDLSICRFATVPICRKPYHELEFLGNSTTLRNL